MFIPFFLANSLDSVRGLALQWVFLFDVFVVLGQFSRHTKKK